MQIVFEHNLLAMGTLFIVSTPIGNLQDITLRAVQILKTVDLVLCEDTRVTGRLLKNFAIDGKLVSFNEFNEESKIAGVIAELMGGKNVALVCDAGTPLISDPGFKLVRTAVSHKIKVESIPGSTSVIAALTISGMAPDKFLFVGYLPKKDKKRMEIIKNMKSVREILKLTLIFFESPYRLIESLCNIQTVFGDIDVVVCRELTKMFEEVRREKVSTVIEHFGKNKPRGEFVVLL